MDVLALILPVFCLMLTGWVLRAIGLVKAEMAPHLIQFVFYVAGPAILFISVATIPFHEIWHWGFILVYGLITLIGFLAIFLGCRYFIKHSQATSALYSLTATLSNAGFIGLPILYAIFGHRALVPGGLSLIVAMIIVTIGVFFLETSKEKHPQFSKFLSKSLLGLLKNPFILAIIAGILYSLTGLGLIKSVKTYFHLFAEALAPCALFAIGLQLSMKSFARNFKSTFFLTFTKLVVMPLIALIFVLIFEIPTLWAITAVIVSGLPTAKTCAIFAEIYEKDKGPKHIVSEAIASSTLLSIVTLIVWLFILNHVYPGMIL